MSLPPAEDNSPEASQQRFESFYDDEILNEPLCNGDTDEVAEQLMNVQADIRLLFTRARRMYNGDTWISHELWRAFQKLEETWDILQNIYDHDGFRNPHDPP